MDIKEIREIAKRYTVEQIEECIAMSLKTGKSPCIEDENIDKILNDLSKAVVVRELMGGGMSFTDALRELAKRMRRLQQGFEE